jgi:hypothetical protein
MAICVTKENDAVEDGVIVLSGIVVLSSTRCLRNLHRFGSTVELSQEMTAATKPLNASGTGIDRPQLRRENFDEHLSPGGLTRLD